MERSRGRSDVFTRRARPQAPCPAVGAAAPGRLQERADATDAVVQLTTRPELPSRSRHACDGEVSALIPKADRLAVLRHELAGGEGSASRIGKDGESHPRRILRFGEDQASEFARSRSDRVRVVDGEGHAPASWA